MEAFASYGRVVFYHTKNDLTVDEDSYLEAVRTDAPDIVVHYGFFGFPVKNEKIRSLLRSLPGTLVIEDCAHKILLKEDIDFIHYNHVYIDSIRKQTSLLGSHLIGQPADLDGSSFQKMNAYKFRCAPLWAIREGAIIAAGVFQAEWLYNMSERYFELLDNAIGTDKNATLGGTFASMLWNHIDFKKMIEHKKDLIQIYTSGFADVRQEEFQVPSVPNENVTYFPCLVSPEVRDGLIEYLEKKNIWMGSLWESPRHSGSNLNTYLLERVIVLPLTWRTSRRDAIRICGAVKDFFMLKEPVRGL